MFESKEELYFNWYLEELKASGVIIGYAYHPKPFSLAENIMHQWIDHKPKRDIEKFYLLMQEHKYQADFIIVWNEKYHKKVYNMILDPVDLRKSAFIANRMKSGRVASIVDVKGNYSQNDAFRRFSTDQKWVWSTYKIYVQKIIPFPNSKGLPRSALFPNTFTPRRYLLTDKNQTIRTIKWKTISISEYLKSI